MQASVSSADVNPARGDTVQSDATASLPRGHSNVAPRIRDAPGDSAARHRVGSQTTPRARAAMNASWTSAQANVGSGSRSTARNHEDRRTRELQAARMTVRLVLLRRVVSYAYPYLTGENLRVVARRIVRCTDAFGDNRACVRRAPVPARMPSRSSIDGKRR